MGRVLRCLACSTKGERCSQPPLCCQLFNVMQILASVEVNGKIANDLRQNAGPVEDYTKVHRLPWGQDFSQRLCNSLEMGQGRRRVWSRVLLPARLQKLCPSKGSGWEETSVLSPKPCLLRGAAVRQGVCRFPDLPLGAFPPLPISHPWAPTHSHDLQKGRREARFRHFWILYKVSIGMLV